MSDADDQMGGSGGETGRRPGGEPPTHASKEAAQAEPRSGGQPGGPTDPGKPDQDENQDEVNQDSEDSFPASDPPARY